MISELNNLNIENPLDAIEEIIFLKHWPCSRANEDELVTEIQSKLCLYRIYLAWSKEINSISITVTFDIKIPESKKTKIYELLSLINENLWIGHFDVTSRSGIPAYRNTYLIGDRDFESIKIIEDMLDIAIFQCEKFYPSFQMVLWESYTAKLAAQTCLLETKGRA